MFIPVSRSEFSDIAGMLEVLGLASLSSLSLSSSFSSAGPSSQGGGKRSLSRSASFGFGRGAMGVGAQEVKIAEGVRSEELLRGLGINIAEGAASASSAVVGDVREEEVRAIWLREKSRLGRDIKAAQERTGKGMGEGRNLFVDAFED